MLNLGINSEVEEYLTKMGFKIINGSVHPTEAYSAVCAIKSYYKKNNLGNYSSDCDATIGYEGVIPRKKQGMRLSRKMK